MVEYNEKGIFLTAKGDQGKGWFWKETGMSKQGMGLSETIHLSLPTSLPAIEAMRRMRP